MIDQVFDFQAAQLYAFARVAQSGGGAPGLFAIETRMGGNQFRDRPAVARYGYFGAAFDLVEECA